jgi:hypothetical protein
VADDANEYQHFEVIFSDGGGMMLFVDPKNPLKFTQKVSGKTAILKWSPLMDEL